MYASDYNLSKELKKKIIYTILGIVAVILIGTSLYFGITNYIKEQQRLEKYILNFSISLSLFLSIKFIINIIITNASIDMIKSSSNMDKLSENSLFDYKVSKLNTDDVKVSGLNGYKIEFEISGIGGLSGALLYVEDEFFSSTLLKDYILCVFLNKNHNIYILLILNLHIL